jgi:selenocysteine lyase/cysteine desulfurase
VSSSAPRSFEDIAALVRDHQVGRRTTIATPFGERLVCYADLTATGRFVTFAERWMRQVRGYYANSHTAVSTTGSLMTRLREDARRIVARSVGAGPDDVVLFCGAGATAAVNKLVGLLGVRIPEPLERRWRLSDHIPAAARPVVFVGPYEHHSNELPWRESIADVVEVGLDDVGGINLDDLATKLAAYADRPLKLGAFSAASNVTGILTDVRAVCRTLHAGGALAILDYAAAGPYVPIDMHPADDPTAGVDALFLSTHKFVAGPQASGILVAHRDLFETRVPERPGGGTVDYVSAGGGVDYVARLHEREEGGTPAILGDLRAGVAFLVKELAGADNIVEHETRLARRALERLGAHPRVRILGPTHLDRLAIVSFNIDGLHHDLVSALLDHLFGIQNRAGCSCAGPYGHRLLGIDVPTSERYRQLIQRGVNGIKPGWVRLSLPWYANEADIDFILDATLFVADHGDAFVPAYQLDWDDGVWRWVDAPPAGPPALALTIDALLAAVDTVPVEEIPLDPAALAAERARYFAEAHALVTTLRARYGQAPASPRATTGDPEVDALVWFDYAACGVVPDGT